MLGLTTYFVGSASLLAVLGALGWAAVRLRAALLPEWFGLPARLAEVVVLLAVPIGVGQLLGSVGAFRPIPMFVGCVGLAASLGAAASRSARRRAPRPVPTRLGPVAARTRRPRAARGEVIAVTFGIAVVAAQWATHVASAISHGMTHVDTLWYHGPYAARFLQSGRLTDLLDRTDALHAYAGQNSELVHALLALPFHRDILSPFVNLGWAALALLSAWCLGRRHRVAPLSVLGVVLVLGLPILAGTHPGQASNDLAAGALLLAAIALLIEGGLQPLPAGFAAVAAGLALGTKLTVAAPIAVLTVGVVVLALRARRSATAVSWCVALVVSGAYWFGRNLALARRPIPSFGFHLGPISLPATVTISGSTPLSHYLTDGHLWSTLFLPGLAQALGRAWPLVVVLPLGGALVVVVTGRPLERLAGLAVAGGAVAYVFTPGTAAAGGLAFAFNVRYFSPSLLVGFALWPLALAGTGQRWRVYASLVMLGLVVVDATSGNHEGTPAWPRAFLLVAVVAGLAVLGAVIAGPRLRLPSDPGRRIAAGLLIVATVVGAGWWIQRDYLEHRYIQSGLALDRVNAVFRKVRSSRVAVIGAVTVYPMFGLDLSNNVTTLNGTYQANVNPCAVFHELFSGQFRYVVLTRSGFAIASLPPREWFTSDPTATKVFDDGHSVVYRLSGPLRPTGC